MHQVTLERVVHSVRQAIIGLCTEGLLCESVTYPSLISDIDGTVGKWQLLLSLLEALAEMKSEKKPILFETLDRIREYRMCRLPFGPVMKEAIAVLPQAMEGLSSDFVEHLAESIVHRDLSLVYAMPNALIRTVRDQEKEKRRLLLSITGAPQFLARPFCQGLGFDVAIGVEYFVDAQGRFTGERDETSAIRKMEILQLLAAECFVSLPESMGLGDTMSDLPIFEMVHTDYRLAINPKPELLDHVRSHPEKRIVCVSDHRSTGVQYYRADVSGGLAEVCRASVLPPEIAGTMPRLIGEKPCPAS